MSRPGAYRARAGKRRGAPGLWPRRISLALCTALTLLVGQVLAAPPDRIAERVAVARVAYDGGAYEEALRLYRELLAAGWESPQLYYNLGCVSYRAGEMGWAVAYLEQARRLAPRDAEIRHNLRVTRAALGGQPLETERSRLLSLLTELLDSYTPADAVRGLLAIGWAAALLLAARWMLGRRGARWMRRAFRLLALLAAVGLIAALLKAHQTRTAPGGVVVRERAAVLAGPRQGEAVQFTVPAGTLLHLGRRAGDWREVWISEEMRGWLGPQSHMEFRPPRWCP